MKKDKPILFSGPMVRAILEGRKTQTRRIVKGSPVRVTQFIGRDDKPTHEFCLQLPHNRVINKHVRCPFGQQGDRLWVRETWAKNDKGIFFKADFSEATINAAPPDWKWKPSIHLKRSDARLTLEVTGVRVERLQDISEADAIAEGAMFTDYGKRCFHDWQGPGQCPSEHHQQREGWSMIPTESSDDCLGTARAAFGNLWDSINKDRAPWESNPWVWVVEFKPI
jgi:hypothetical protein